MTHPPMLMPVATAGLPGFKDVSGTWQQFMGIPTGDQADYLRGIQDYGKAPADEAWVYRCVSLKSFFAQGVPLRVYVREGKERVPAEDSGDAAAEDLQFLLDDVNPVSMNGGDLKAFSNAAINVWGENYVRKVRGRLGGPPQELWWLRAPDVKPKLGRVWIDAYDYSDRHGGTEEYAARDVIAWRRTNLQDPTRGLSPLSAIRYEVSFGRNLAEKRTQRLVNWGVPPGAWIIPEGADWTTQDTSLVQRALKLLRGPKGAGRVPILPQGLKWQNIALSPQDLEELHAGKVSRMAVCAVMGVPLVLAGDDEKTSVYANMRDAERIFARYMISELDWTADGFQGWLVPDFDRTKKRLVVAFDYSQIEALQAPIEDRKRVALAEIEHSARTPDEYRAEFRIGQPLPNDQGKAVYQLLQLVPVGIGPETEPAETVAPPDDAPADTIRHLYRHPAVRAYLSGGPLEPVAQLLRVPAGPALKTGLARRYTVPQLLDGVPAEGFPGLRTRATA